MLPESVVPLPGYDQGGDASSVRALLDRHGGGVLVNSSRGILYAHEGSALDYQEAAREAARGRGTNCAWSRPACRTIRDRP